MSAETAAQHESLLNQSEAVIDEIFARCSENAPNFGVRNDCFKESLKKAARKYLFSNASADISVDEVKSFFGEI